MAAEKKDFNCIVPWIGGNFDPFGDFVACCFYRKPVTKSDTLSEDISQLRNSEDLKEVRKCVLKNVPAKGCEHCHEADFSGQGTLKKFKNEQFQHLMKLQRLTDENGAIPNMPIYALELQFSNTCNFKCRICGPTYSTAWQRETSQYFPEQNLPPASAVLKRYPKFWEQMENTWQHVEEIYFWGGEPLLMPEHLKTLELLRQHGNTKVRLRYSSNFSVDQFMSVDLFKNWQDFPNVSLFISIDGSHQRGEYQRHGMKWPKVLELRQKLREKAPHVDVHVSCATSAFNIWHVPDLHRELIENDFVSINQFQVNMLTDPDYMSCQILPLEFKKQVQNKIEQHIQFLKKHPRTEPWIVERFQAAVDHMFAKDQSHLFSKFKERNSQLDQIRQESFLETFPEFQSFYEH